MKHILVTLVSLTAFLQLLLSGCGEPVSKKVIGVWLIEDIEVSGDVSMVDPIQLEKNIEGQKKLRFELKQDSSISIYTGSDEISGSWRYDKASNQVLVTFEGNREATLLGTYEDGKLVNVETSPVGMVLTTVFIKEVKEEE